MYGESKENRWTSVAEELRTYPFLNPTLTLTNYQLTGEGRGKYAVAQILILIHKITVNNLKVKGQNKQGLSKQKSKKVM